MGEGTRASFLATAAPAGPPATGGDGAIGNEDAAKRNDVFSGRGRLRPAPLGRADAVAACRWGAGGMAKRSVPELWLRHAAVVRDAAMPHARLRLAEARTCPAAGARTQCGGAQTRRRGPRSLSPSTAARAYTRAPPPNVEGCFILQRTLTPATRTPPTCIAANAHTFSRVLARRGDLRTCGRTNLDVGRPDYSEAGPRHPGGAGSAEPAEPRFTATRRRSASLLQELLSEQAAPRGQVHWQPGQRSTPLAEARALRKTVPCRRTCGAAVPPEPVGDALPSNLTECHLDSE